MPAKAYKSEFDALLSVSQSYIDANKGTGKYYDADEELSEGSKLLRSIFGVSDDDGSDADADDEYEFTSLKTIAFKSNY